MYSLKQACPSAAGQFAKPAGTLSNKLQAWKTWSSASSSISAAYPQASQLQSSSPGQDQGKMASSSVPRFRGAVRTVTVWAAALQKNQYLSAITELIWSCRCVVCLAPELMVAVLRFFDALTLDVWCCFCLYRTTLRVIKCLVKYCLILLTKDW